MQFNNFLPIHVQFLRILLPDMGINDVMKPLNNDSSIVLLLKNPQYARNPNPDLVVPLSSVWMRIVADSLNQYPDGNSPGDKPQNF